MRWARTVIQFFDEFGLRLGDGIVGVSALWFVLNGHHLFGVWVLGFVV